MFSRLVIGGTLASMTEEERTLIASLGLALVQTNLEFAFYKKKSGAGEISSTGHPDFYALE